MRFENTSVYNIYNAILGARNPHESWNKSDSIFNGFDEKIENTTIGENDLKLAQTLISLRHTTSVKLSVSSLRISVYFAIRARCMISS